MEIWSLYVNLAPQSKSGMHNGWFYFEYIYFVWNLQKNVSFRFLTELLQNFGDDEKTSKSYLAATNHSHLEKFFIIYFFCRPV